LIIKKIGSGTFGKVFLAKNIKSEMKVAIKIYDLRYSVIYYRNLHGMKNYIEQ